MGVALANLIGRAGRARFHHYCEAVLNRPPPPLPDDSDLRGFGREMEFAVRRDFSPTQYLQVWRDLQRVRTLSDRSGKDCLRFSARRLDVDIGTFTRSAFQEALFCFLEHRTVFLAAEVIMAQGRWGRGGRFCNLFQLDAPCPPERFTRLTDAFCSAVGLMLRGLTGEDVSLRIDQIIMVPLLPIGARPQLHIIVVWGDSSEPLPILDENGPGLINPPIQRTAGLSLGADGRTVTVFGVGLGHDGREKLVQIFGDLVAQGRRKPTLVPRIGCFLHLFANRRELTFPARSDVHQFGIDGIRYIPPGCENAVTQEVNFPLTAWDSITRERGEVYARGELSGACVLGIQLRIELHQSSIFPEGRVIRGRLTRDGYVLERGLDVDHYITEACLSYLGVFRPYDDLLGRVG